MIRHLACGEELAAAAAALVAEELRSSAAAGWFSLALAGGRTPVPTYRRLGTIWRDQPLPWRRGLMTPGDERLVAVGDTARNDRMIREALLAGLPEADEVFLPLVTEPEAEVERAAAAAENRLRASWYGELTPEGMPRFDLMLLGLGADGHTASIFADSPALSGGGGKRWVMAVPAPPSVAPCVARLTLTGPVIRAARRVVFLVAGQDKVAVAQRILSGAGADLPAARVRPPTACDWLLTEAAGEPTKP